MQQVIEDSDALRNIAANIRFLLQERGMTQSQLHDATGETHMTISRMVNGKNMPGAAALARVAEALRTSTDWLLADHSKEFQQTA